MEQPVAQPAVVTWFKVYCGVMAALYLAFAGLGVAILAGALPAPETEADALAKTVVGVLYLLMGIVLAGVFVAGVVLKPKRWVWIYDLVLICLGMSSCLLLPACVPLLIFWLRPEAKVWFGRNP